MAPSRVLLLAIKSHLPSKDYADRQTEDSPTEITEARTLRFLHSLRKPLLLDVKEKEIAEGCAISPNECYPAWIRIEE